MVVTLNFYLDPELSYSWQESLVLAAKAMGHGVTHAWNLHKWIKHYFHREKLPLHWSGTYHSLILEAKDFCRDILLRFQSKGYPIWLLSIHFGSRSTTAGIVPLPLMCLDWVAKCHTVSFFYCLPLSIQTWDPYANSMKMAAQFELVVSTEKERYVHWWPWTWGHCGI